jgi:glycosyltransferase involved in cell wall biosynthesis
LVLHPRLHMKKKIVISAINSFGGGVLSVVQDCLQEMIKIYGDKIEIIALVYDKSLIGIEGVTYLEFPKARSKWVERLYLEYVYFYQFSKKVKPDIWLSLADVTPRVEAPIRAVYCHNLAPFYKTTWKDTKFDPVLAIYHYIFKYIYRANIKKNKYVIVQQQWLRNEFERMFKIKNVLVAYPNVHIPKNYPLIEQKTPDTKQRHVFFYPSIPRVFKNFEIIAEAAELLIEKGITNFEIVFTFNGTENSYAKSIYKKYSKLNQLTFSGELNRKQVFEYYQQADAIIFASKTETWGMGISEGIIFKKPILAIDLPYARETAGDYSKITFFEPNAPESLAIFMSQLIHNQLIYGKNKAVNPPAPFAKNWQELFGYLGLGDKQNVV